jgi:predicted TIM-barrel fold metal-dependent hydrolase
VKLSGADIVTWETSDFSGATPFARALVEANPDRLVWGSDWPHLVHHASGIGDDAPPAAYRPVDEAALLRFLRDWAGSEDILARILVTNPAQLYQF